MKLNRILVGSLLVGLCAQSLADEVKTHIKIPGWTIETSEKLYMGSRHTSYPPIQMLDGKAETAWVFSGRTYPQVPAELEEFVYDRGYWVRLIPDKPIVMDELRLMNGYNKSEEIFRRNSRVTRVNIYNDDGSYQPLPRQPLRSVALSDKMGMKSIRLPRQKYDSLLIELVGIEKGIEDDLCISELMVRDGGIELIRRPKTYLMFLGDECGCSNIGELRRTSRANVGTL